MSSQRPWTDNELINDWVRRYSKERRQVVSPLHADKDEAASGKLEAETFWAFDELHELVSRDPSRAWVLILQILRRSPGDENVRDNLAAGPLEDLLSKHGQVVIDRVEEEAQSNPRFKELLAGVWNSGMSEEIWQRVQRTIG